VPASKSGRSWTTLVVGVHGAARKQEVAVDSDGEWVSCTWSPVAATPSWSRSLAVSRATHAFVKVRQRWFGGWHGGGGAALPSSSGVRPVRVELGWFVSFVWVSSTYALGVRCRCMCLMLMFWLQWGQSQTLFYLHVKLERYDLEKNIKSWFLLFGISSM
jgi:hypothetical protein